MAMVNIDLLTIETYRRNHFSSLVDDEIETIIEMLYTFEDDDKGICKVIIVDLAEFEIDNILPKGLLNPYMDVVIRKLLIEIFLSKINNLYLQDDVEEMNNIISNEVRTVINDFHLAEEVLENINYSALNRINDSLEKTYLPERFKAFYAWIDNIDTYRPDYRAILIAC